ncbi:winged helix-turn-helix domain-containing protein [Loktanella sp. SALINAS62]|uniref:winged helix-turn-helix domain-containing tetratricopeptide repeat protein n=1 Tax=Loktanella sp. SALINAS62 TaxID=2706124 RepID=UPI001B8AA057|nr:winged helix-turn-helix domain-containing protein [Loktanella sp. SALINAS62]MBS1303293.1 transcriptional regulator [Loktanella sp. SALINAS62]
MAWTFGDFHLDPDGFQLARHGVAVPLEPQVLALLIHLVRHHDRMVSKDEVVEAVWHGRAVSDASISSRIRSVRQALDDDGARQEMIQTVHGRGFRFVAKVTTTMPACVLHGAPTIEPPEQIFGKPSIAILPFRPLGLEPTLAVFAEAIPHEIIEALSRLRWLAVIARGSSFRFREGEADMDMVTKALSARYVLAGIIECRGTGLAVTLELVDAKSRQVLWADRLESQLDEMDELRSRIVAHLVAALETHIPFNEARVAELNKLEDLDAWANYHVGLRHLYRFTTADTEQALTCFERAVASDPTFARAHAGLSFTSFLSAFLRLDPDRPAAVRATRHHAERAMEFDALDPFANFTMGRSFWLTDEPEVAAEWLSRATALNPNYAQGFYASAFTAMLIGDAAATTAALDTSLHLSPLDPLLYGVHGVRAQMLMQLEDYEAAAGWADRAAAQPGAHYLIGMIALVANGLADRHERTGSLGQDIRRRKPDATAADYFTAFPTRDVKSRARIAAELARQGF